MREAGFRFRIREGKARIFPRGRGYGKCRLYGVAFFLVIGGMFSLACPATVSGMDFWIEYGSSSLMDIPVPADYDGDGIMDIAVFRPGEGKWFIKLSSTGEERMVWWGTFGDEPFPGDYDGDGKADFILWRPSENRWHIKTSSELRLPAYDVIQLRDSSDGTKKLWYEIQVVRPNRDTVTDKNLIQDVKIYAYPGYVEMPQTVPWSFVYDPYFYYDTNGNDTTPAIPYPWSEVDGYLVYPLPPGSPFFYNGVVTDISGNKHKTWLYYEPPTEVTKVQNATMSATNNADGTVTLSWANPPELDPGKHIIRLYISSSADLSGDGYGDNLLMVGLPTTSNSYNISTGMVSYLKGFTNLYWYVQIRHRLYNVTNPDLTTKTYDIYRNYGQYKTLSLP